MYKRQLFRVLAPFMPHVCDELNAGIFGGSSVNARGSWPKIAEHFYDEKNAKEGANAVELIAEVRKFKSENGLSLKTELDNVTYEGFELSESTEKDLKNAANAKSFGQSSGSDFKVSCKAA